VQNVVRGKVCLSQLALEVLKVVPDVRLEFRIFQRRQQAVRLIKPVSLNPVSNSACPRERINLAVRRMIRSVQSQAWSRKRVLGRYDVMKVAEFLRERENIF